MGRGFTLKKHDLEAKAKAWSTKIKQMNEM
jgi:hypothetical protein